MAMDIHEPFDHQVFLPVAEALVDRLFFSPATKAPPTSENSDLLRRAEAWASGEQVAAPVPSTPAPGVFAGPSDGPDLVLIWVLIWGLISWVSHGRIIMNSTTMAGKGGFRVLKAAVTKLHQVFTKCSLSLLFS